MSVPLPNGGVPAETPKEVQSRVKELERAGVDLIGLSTDRRYQGTVSAELSPAEKERVQALVEASSVPTIVMGGVTPSNVAQFRALRVQVLIVGTAFDDVTKAAIRELIYKLLP